MLVFAFPASQSSRWAVVDGLPGASDKVEVLSLPQTPSHLARDISSNTLWSSIRSLDLGLE